MKSLAPGAYDLLITESRRRLIDSLPATLRAQIERLEPADAVEYLARELADRFRRAARQLLDDDKLKTQFLNDANSILGLLGSDRAELSTLTRVQPAVESASPNPIIPLAQSALVTNDQRLNYHAILRSELRSADHVDLICPFIGIQGLNLIVDLLRPLGSKLRVITTTYLGGTHRNAIDRLVSFGCQVKIAYERPEQKTALHAKAWIFHRNSGFTTATIGSSNLSPHALVDGLEWNLRVSTVDAPLVIEELKTTFDRLWEDIRFEPYDPSRDGERLTRALAGQRSEDTEQTFFVDVHPFRHQQTALESLRLSRLDGKHRNLVVAATGTGKTMIAAFDYAQLAKEWSGLPRLLFVAHREDILKQARSAYRTVLRQGDFAELNVGIHRAESWSHVFASIQSLHDDLLSQIDPTQFDVVVVDEFHHAEAPTYRKLLAHVKSKEVLGLTATPERTDGNDDLIRQFGDFAYELRLWQALEAELVSPFHYFGIDDGLDLSDLEWRSGKYELGALEARLMTHAEERFGLIMRELADKVVDLNNMRAVAFCVSTRHASDMAERFVKAGIDAAPLHSQVDSELREATMSKFRRGQVKLLCTVDLLNEGIDVPEIDVIIFLRPTESPVIFTQQLGRGLRLQKDKAVLTVLDFVGQQNKKFRLDLRYRAMTGLTPNELERAIKNDFPILPPGCHIKLDRVSRERALRNLRDAIPTSRRELLQELRRLLAGGNSVDVGRFLSEVGLEPLEFYRSGRSLFELLHDVGHLVEVPNPKQGRLSAIAHVDDLLRCESYIESLQSRVADGFSRMVSYPLAESVDVNEVPESIRVESIQLLNHLRQTAPRRPRLAEDLPFSLHGSYTRDEIVAPFRDNPTSMRQGTFYVKSHGLDVHLVTLRKSERFFSESTMYKDRVLGYDLIQWESQSFTSQESPTGQRLLKSVGRQLLFVRENRDDPFHCLGFATSCDVEGEKPILLKWKLEHPIPDELYPRFRSAS